jgi:hypothetical protein
MTSTATSDNTAAHLTIVIDSWPHLTDMLTTRHGSTWPPAMGIEHVLHDGDDAEADLLHLADVLAQEVQRQPMPKAPSHWLPEDRALRDKLAAEDKADIRRWRYRDHRTAPHAAAWLLGRVQHQPGPFLRLTTEQARRVAAVAGKAAGRIEQTLDAVRTAQVVDRPCPLCGGILGLSSGDGRAPLVVCFGCRQEWTAAA